MTRILNYVRVRYLVGVYQPMEDEEFLSKCVVAPTKRTFYLYSNEGDTKVVDCDDTEQFMNVLEVVRKLCPEERLSYSNPLIY